MACDERKAINEDYSTLAVIDKAYGDNSASMWLAVAITNLNEFCGSKSMTDNQIQELAYIIANEYKDQKFSVLMLFFYKFKCGYFGKFYGKVDPMVITCALKDFVEECEHKRQRYLEEEAEQRRQQEAERMERMLQVETEWESCKYALMHNTEDVAVQQLFSRLNMISYNEERNTLLLSVTRDDCEKIEGQHLDYFRTHLRERLPKVVVMYKIREPKVTEQPVEHVKDRHSREIATGLDSARKILSNTLGIERDLIEKMKFSFRLRYQLTPEEFLNRYEKSK